MLWRIRCWFFPELDLFGSREEAQEAFRDCWREQRRDPLYWLWLTLAIAVFAVLPLACFITPTLYSGPATPPSVLDRIPEELVFLGALILFIVLPSLLHHICWSGMARKRLREQLAIDGRPKCSGCGYDLRGQIEPRCPECGKPFDERLLQHTPQTSSDENDRDR
jgi:hypothetical protein